MIYTLGYQGTSVDALADWLDENPAFLVDIRFSPRSKNINWSGQSLKARFGNNYIHLQALGNRNYRGGGPIQLVDPEKGVRVLSQFLQTLPCVLLCACANLNTCHRLEAANLLAERLGEEVVHLRLSGEKPAVEDQSQMGLFPEEEKRTTHWDQF
jgi:uncharacterized protein (DUF488 family)